MPEESSGGTDTGAGSDTLATRSLEFVRSLERGLSVIRAFDAEHPRRSLSDVARACGMTPAAARRFLLTLVELGYATQEDGRFALTPSVLGLGYSHLSNLSLPEVAEPHLRRLAGQVRESVSLSVLDGDEVLYLARVAATGRMNLAINVGARFPAWATSMGRVLLAGLSDAEIDDYLARAELRPFTPRTLVEPDALREEVLKVRAAGWCMVDQELEEGVLAVAVPLRWRSSQVVAAINASTHATGLQAESRRQSLLPPLLAAASDIESDLAVYPSLHRYRSPGDATR